MKIRNSSRITAIVLALMMIVPLISVPTFAETATATAGELIWSEDFEDVAALSEVYSATGSLAQLKDLADGEHGKVYYNDNKPGTDAEPYYAAAAATNNGPYYQISNPVVEGTTMTSGTVTIDGTEYTISNAPIGTTNFGSSTTATAGETTKTVYVITSAVRECRLGTGNIAAANTVALSSKITSEVEYEELVFVADYYFSSDYNRPMDIRVYAGITQDFFSLKDNGTQLTVVPHGDVVKYCGYNTNTVNINKGEWVTFAAVIRPSTGEFTLYANDSVVASGVSGRLPSFKIDSKSTWNLGHTTRGAATTAYAGHWMVDNLAIYNGETQKYKINTDIYTLDFENGETYSGVIDYSSGTASITNTYKGQTISNHFAADFSSDEKAQTGEALNVGGAGDAGNVDRNLKFSKTPKITYGAGLTSDVVIFEADYYIPTDATYQFQIQLHGMTADWYGDDETFTTVVKAATSQSWIQLSSIDVQNGKITGASAGNSFDSNPTVTSYDFNVPTGQWVTISTAIDLVTGKTRLYLDGQLAKEWQINYSNASHGYAKNITIDTNKWIAAKLSKTKNYTNGYLGDLLVDNVAIYRASAPRNLATDYVTYNGDAGENKGWLDLASPFSSANYVAKENADVTVNLAPDGTTALQFPLGLAATTPATVANPYFSGPNNRVYVVVSDAKVATEGFDPASVAVVDDADTGYVALDWFNANTTLVHSTYGSTDKFVYYLLSADGQNAYAWMTTQEGATIQNISRYAGSYPVAQPNADGTYDAKAYYFGHGDGVVDNYTILKHPEYTKETHGAVAFNAEYYVAEEAGGKIECQFISGWFNLYRIDFNSNELEALNGAKVIGTAKLNVDAWNKVTFVVDMNNDTITYYVNGVYVAQNAFTNDSIAANQYIVTKVAKVFTAADVEKFNGNYWINNVRTTAYDATNVQTVDASAVLEWNIDGFKSTNLVAENATIYVEDSYTTVSVADFAGIVNTLDVASIRMGEYTGLRFATEMDTALLAELEAMGVTVSYGTLIAPMDDGTKGGGTDLSKLTHALEYVLDVKCANYYKDIDENAETEHFVGSIVNINELNLDRAFSGRGYVIVTLANGNVHYIYSEAIKTISVADQAQATMDDANVWNSLTDAQKAIVEGFAAANAN